MNVTKGISLHVYSFAAMRHKCDNSDIAAYYFYYFRCKCSQNCTNRLVQHGLKWKLQVFKTSMKGYAIRTLQDIPQGSFICVYTGELLSSKQANEVLEF